MTVWLNGVLGAGALDPADRGFLLGDGLFETIRIAEGAARHLDRHLARLRAGAAKLELPVPAEDAAIEAAIQAVARADGIARGSARVTLSRGAGPRGLMPPSEPSPTLLVTAAPEAGPSAGAADLVIARTVRRNELSPLSRLKTLNYLDNVLAKQEAVKRGADDAVLLNTRGQIAEASAANLVLVIDGTAVTPPVADGALPGIARGLLIERLGVEQRSVTREALAQSEGLLLVNSLGLRTAWRLDGKPVPPFPAELLERCTEACR